MAMANITQYGLILPCGLTWHPKKNVHWLVWPLAIIIAHTQTSTSVSFDLHLPCHCRHCHFFSPIYHRMVLPLPLSVIIRILKCHWPPPPPIDAINSIVHTPHIHNQIVYLCDGGGNATKMPIRINHTLLPFFTHSFIFFLFLFHFTLPLSIFPFQSILHVGYNGHIMVIIKQHLTIKYCLED